MKFLSFLFALIFLAACSSDQKSLRNETIKPNVILIMTDDQGWGDLGIHGNDSISTPNLDALAKNGIRFNRFFVSPVCAPTRASLLTGRYHLRTGTSWVTHRKEVMRSEETTIAESLKTAGYRTGIFGKWHNGEQYPNNPEGQGFDEFLGFCAGHWNNYQDPNLLHNGEPVKRKGYINDVFTDAAIEWINEKSDQPFFCYIPYNTPHSPFQVPDKYFDKYKKMGLNDKNASVHGMCENIDDNFGKMMQMLEAKNIADHTIVLFLTDNGPNGRRFNGGMRGTKGSVHEGGMRVPLFMKWGDRFERGKVIQPITSHMDLLPTLLDLCAIKPTPGAQLDGKSLVPLINESNPDWEDRQFYHIQANGTYSILNSALRNEQHRFVIERDSTMRLFDMQNDPGQKKNIIDDYPELQAKYLADIKKWFAEVTARGMEVPPIPVDQRSGKHTLLPAPESKLKGNLKFKGKMGWANDYIIDWSSAEDAASWPVEVFEEGDYQVEVAYVCKQPAVEAELSISNDHSIVRAKITEAFYPDFHPSPDRVKRGEVYERDWKKLTLGQIKLKQGSQNLTLTSSPISSDGNLEIKSIQLIKRER